MQPQVALITGASRGIGKATALAFAEAGFDVAITARTLREGERYEHASSVKTSDTSPMPGSLELTAGLIEEPGRRAFPIRMDLLDVYALNHEDWASILFTGSGTSALEAMMTSFVPAHGKVLIIENGVYGERLSKIAKIHDLDHVVMHHEWGEAINLEKLEGELQYHEELSHVAVVHHETTSGRLKTE